MAIVDPVVPNEFNLYFNFPQGNVLDSQIFYESNMDVFPDPLEIFECDPEYQDKILKYFCVGWNTSSDGTGTAYKIGDTIPTYFQFYAIWQLNTKYITTKQELVSIADAIRKKGGTSQALTYPNTFATAITAIEAGSSSGGYTIDDIAKRNMMSGEITGSASFIASYAFYFCSFLTAANFSNCTIISNYAFYQCNRLTTINFPNCTSIGDNAFYFCTSLTTINFPSCTSIGGNAFYYCTSLITISFPNCTSIGAAAFQNCTSLTTINFPSCTSIGGNAFNGCTSLTTVSFPNCTSIGNYAFSGCTYLTTIKFPTAITSIRTGAFQNVGRSATSATMISFYSYVDTIQSYAFRSCYKLQSLYLNHVSKIPTLSGNAFISTPIGGYSTSLGAYGSIYVPTSLLASFKAATNWTAISARIVAG